MTMTEPVEPIAPADNGANFTCPRNDLAEVLATASRVVKPGHVPALGGIRFEVVGDKLVVAATDLDMTIVADVHVTGEGNGVSVLPAKLVAEVVRSLDTPVKFSADGTSVRVQAGKSKFDLRSFPAAEFPRLPVPSGESIALETKGFLQGLTQVLRASSDDASRPILTGVLFSASDGVLRLVATDSYRLAICDIPGSGNLAVDRPLVVPARALSELVRLLQSNPGAVVKVGAHDISFLVGEVTLTTQLIEGEYPNYRKLIPESPPNVLRASKAPFAEAVKRVKLMARDSSTPLQMKLGGDGTLGSMDLRVTAADTGMAEEEVEATYEGTAMTVAFNPGYLLDGIESAPGDQVALSLVDSLKPALLTGTEEGFTYLVMPVRV